MPYAFPGAYARILSVYGIRTQVDLAERLGIRQSSISDAKRRGSMPDAWLLTALLDTGVNPAWLASGEGSKYLAPTDEAPGPISIEDIKQASDAELIGELALRLRKHDSPEAHSEPLEHPSL